MPTKRLPAGKFILKLITTFFYVGYLPFVPGTFASAVGLLLFYLIKGNVLVYSIVTVTLLSLGLGLSGKAERMFNQKDSPCIVIDEVSGILLAFLFLPYDIKLMLIAFGLFRICDALKPFPADRLQRLKGSIGIMSDDIICGLYVNILLRIVLKIVAL